MLKLAEYKGGCNCVYNVGNMYDDGIDDGMMMILKNKIIFKKIFFSFYFILLVGLRLKIRNV